VTDPLYVEDGGRFLPQPITQGPWSPDAQHGGPVAALLARTVEAVPAPTPMQVVRLTIELLRPVPLTPLTTTAAVVRPGKRVQLVDARLQADGTDVAWARALRIRVQPLELPDVAIDARPSAPPQDAVAATTAFHVPYADAVDLRFVRGDWSVPGPVTMWTRLRSEVVAGEAPTPLQRAAGAADFGNGVSWVLDFATHVFINPDLCVSLARQPRGEWVGFDVVTRLSSDGVGLAESEIFDPDGPVGRATQSLLVERR
jgi:Thioesterase-like superfamily